MLLSTNRVRVASKKLDGLALYHHQMSLKLARLRFQVTFEIEDLFFFFFTIVLLYILYKVELFYLVGMSLLFG